MSNEEARDYIIKHCNPDYPNGKMEWNQAINLAITALEENQKLKAMVDALADCLDGTPLPHPCCVSLEFCKKYCMGGEAEPSKELWLKWAEVKADE